MAPAHLEGVGSLDGVAKAKGELFLGLGGHDTAIVNADDPKIMEKAASLACAKVYYSTDADAASRLPQEARFVTLLQATPLGEEGFSASVHSFDMVGCRSACRWLGATRSQTRWGRSLLRRFWVRQCKRSAIRR